jgi:thiamine phosphate synthase YjbQ (UPF0047 family)
MTFTHTITHKGKRVICHVRVEQGYMTFYLQHATQLVKVWDMWTISKNDLKEIFNKYKLLKNS